MTTQDQLTKAIFTGNRNREIEVHFNPASLQYKVENSIRNQGRGDRNKQYITQRTGKLSMELVFDTTGTGQDVRNHTGELASFMKGSERRRSAQALKFKWGAYVFQGMMESYKENLDFFSPDGVPLRSTVNVTLAGKDKEFEPARATPGRQPGLSPEAVEVPTAGSRDATRIGQEAGNADAGLAIAEANGLENPRFPEQDTLFVTDSVPLKPPAAFAAGGIGFSAGADIGIAGGAGIGVGGGMGIGVDAAASAGIVIGAGAGASGATMTVGLGAKSSAGVSASAGAFAGLRTSVSAKGVSAQLDVEGLLAVDESVNLAAGAGASFGIGGRAEVRGSASLNADVGAAGDLQARIQFDEE